MVSKFFQIILNSGVAGDVVIFVHIFHLFEVYCVIVVMKCVSGTVV